MKDVSHIRIEVTCNGLTQLGLMSLTLRGDKNQLNLPFASKYLFFICRKSSVSGEFLRWYTSMLILDILSIGVYLEIRMVKAMVYMLGKDVFLKYRGHDCEAHHR